MICFSNTAGHLYQIVSNHNPMKFYICHWSLYLVISPMIVVLIYVKSWLSTVFIMLYDNPDYYAPSKLYEMSLWDVHMSSLGSVVGDKVKWKTALNTYIKTLFLIILYVWQIYQIYMYFEKMLTWNYQKNIKNGNYLYHTTLDSAILAVMQCSALLRSCCLCSSFKSSRVMARSTQL